MEMKGCHTVDLNDSGVNYVTFKAENWDGPCHETYYFSGRSGWRIRCWVQKTGIDLQAILEPLNMEGFASTVLDFIPKEEHREELIGFLFTLLCQLKMEFLQKN